MRTYKDNIWKLYIFHFLRSMHFTGGVLVPFFTIWGGISLTQVFILQSWFMICIFLLEVPTGAVADRYGRKTSIILATLIGIAAPLVYASYPAFTIFFIAESLWALSSSLLSGAGEALTYDTLKKLKREDESKKFFARVKSFYQLVFVLKKKKGDFRYIRAGAGISRVGHQLQRFNIALSVLGKVF